jgi:hypothetical protein
MESEAEVKLTKSLKQLRRDARQYTIKYQTIMDSIFEESNGLVAMAGCKCAGIDCNCLNTDTVKQWAIHNEIDRMNVDAYQLGRREERDEPHDRTTERNSSRTGAPPRGTEGHRMRLTTERLDALFEGTERLRGTGRFADTERLALIDAARLQVALDECEALKPEGWCIDLDNYYAGYRAQAWNPTGGVSKGFVNGAWCPTPLAAYLALRDALKEPR